MRFQIRMIMITDWFRQLTLSFIKPARSRSPFKASVKDWYSISIIDRLAMMMMSKPCFSRSANDCITDLIRRLAKFRWTAPPTDRPAMTATRFCSNWLGKKPTTTDGCAKDFPSLRTRLISALRFNLELLFNQLPVRQDTSVSLDLISPGIVSTSVPSSRDCSPFLQAHSGLLLGVASKRHDHLWSSYELWNHELEHGVVASVDMFVLAFSMIPFL